MFNTSRRARLVSPPPPLAFLHKDLVFFLAELSHAKRKKVISALKKKHIDCLAEIFFNFLKKNLTVDKSIIKSLSKYKNDIRKIAKKRESTDSKRRILKSQRGGAILSVLLPLAASVITGLLSK